MFLAMKPGYILCILIIPIFSYGYAYLYEGDKCHTNVGVPGICKVFFDCAAAQREFEKYKTHSFKRCGFNEIDEEIICCPEPVVIRREQTKSERACIQYIDDSEELSPSVAGGTDAAEKEFPHMAALAFNRSGKITYDCGGSLISHRFVLTAAHCFVYEVSPFGVRLGITVLNDTNHVDVDIKKSILHPSYNARTKYNDIALIELTQRLDLTDRILPACLYSKSDDPLGLVVTGWGITLKNETYALQKATLTAVSVGDCTKFFSARSLGLQKVWKKEICANGTLKDSCRGDSGGPLQITNENGGYMIVGIVSYGPGSCTGTVPGVYTRVSSYLDWIEDHVWRNDSDF